MTEKIRCAWAIENEKMADYHDTVWGVPEYEDKNLFAKLSLDLMQAGLSWQTILNKQENFLKAFDDFEIEIVAAYDEEKYNELLLDAGIVRNRLKIRAIINNAQRVQEIQKEFGSFSNYLWNFVLNQPEQHHIKNISEVPTSTTLSDRLSKDLKKRGFKFVGTTIVYSFLQACGLVNDHVENCFRYNDLV
ncbi:MAG: DNA-3-methyladenine glycosylase I [Lactobacillales bacterium]|nr:DNA-3-methyladenine glycosylase I [Lactobacillales bacterium]